MGAFRRVAICAAVLVAATSCTSSDPPEQVRDLVSKLDDAGLPCTGLSIEEPGPSETTRPADESPVPSAMGFCHLEGDGSSLSSIYVFENDDHVQFAKDRGGFPDVSIVYGDTFEMQVVPAAKGSAVRDALGGTLIPPSTTETSDRAVYGTLSRITAGEVCLRGPGCFKLTDDSTVEAGLEPGEDVEVGLLRGRKAKYVRAN
jgi:hypothetical protein